MKNLTEECCIQALLIIEHIGLWGHFLSWGFRHIGCGASRCGQCLATTAALVLGEVKKDGELTEVGCAWPFMSSGVLCNLYNLQPHPPRAVALGSPFFGRVVDKRCVSPTVLGEIPDLVDRHGY